MTKATEIKIDEVRKWWEEIRRLETCNGLVDTQQFADYAHSAIPVLLAEIERLQKVKK